MVIGEDSPPPLQYYCSTCTCVSDCHAGHVKRGQLPHNTSTNPHMPAYPEAGLVRELVHPVPGGRPQKLAANGVLVTPSVQQQ